MFIPDYPVNPLQKSSEETEQLKALHSKLSEVAKSITFITAKEHEIKDSFVHGVDDVICINISNNKEVGKQTFNIAKKRPSNHQKLNFCILKKD